MGAMMDTLLGNPVKPPHYDDDHPFYIPPTTPKVGPLQFVKPLLYTPLTRLGEDWFCYSDTKCAVYEDLLLKCAYQGSRAQMYKNCVKEMEDFEECTLRLKQIARFQVIQKERSKQGKFEEKPLPDIYWERGAR